MAKVGIVMGSDSDFPVMESCFRMLQDLGLSYEAHVCSAHRTPDQAAELSKKARDNGFGVIIAAAGLAAHLPGVLAAYTILPVIGVPIRGGALNGQDALYSIAQMPAGIPVATVAIDGAANAAILAAQILAGADDSISEKLVNYKENLAAAVKARHERLQDKLAELR